MVLMNDRPAPAPEAKPEPTLLLRYVRVPEGAACHRLPVGES